MDQIQLQELLRVFREQDLYEYDDDGHGTPNMWTIQLFFQNLWDVIEGLNERILQLEGTEIPCDCGWGGVHDPDNPRCDRNQG